jgi:hypothetical protein
LDRLRCTHAATHWAFFATSFPPGGTAGVPPVGAGPVGTVVVAADALGAAEADAEALALADADADADADGAGEADAVPVESGFAESAGFDEVDTGMAEPSSPSLSLLPQPSASATIVKLPAMKHERSANDLIPAFGCMATSGSHATSLRGETQLGRRARGRVGDLLRVRCAA